MKTKMNGSKWIVATGCIFAFSILSAPMEAAYTLHNGGIVDVDNLATLALEDHYAEGVAAFECGNWREARRQFGIVAYNFPHSPCGQESFFYEGVANFNLEEFDAANEAFSNYLQCKNHPKMFQEALEYKFAIAEKFRGGARRRLMGSRKLPKWASGQSTALQIYDEIIAAVPCHELAVCALYSKALLNWSCKEYEGCIESLQNIVRRFPKHEMTPECYVLINKVYLDQCSCEVQNPDILALAQINLRRFEQNFPKEERLSLCANDVLEIKERHAAGLYNTGVFYERVRKPNAAAIYYYNAVVQFPETVIGEMARERLMVLGFEVPSEAKDTECPNS